MILNDELLSVQRGEQGEAMQKVLNTLVMYGEAFGAERMVKITGQMGHAVIGTGSLTWKPVFDLMEKLIAGGAIPKQSFTTDPREEWRRNGKEWASRMPMPIPVRHICLK